MKINEIITEANAFGEPKKPGFLKTLLKGVGGQKAAQATQDWQEWNKYKNAPASDKYAAKKSTQAEPEEPQAQQPAPQAEPELPPTITPGSTGTPVPTDEIIKDFTVASYEPLVIQYNKKRFHLNSQGRWALFGSDHPIKDETTAALLDKVADQIEQGAEEPEPEIRTAPPATHPAQQPTQPAAQQPADQGPVDYNVPAYMRKGKKIPGVNK